MMNCILCSQRMTPAFSTRDYRRLNDRREWQLNYCATCKFWRLAGDFTPQEIASFYPADYYTHGVQHAIEPKLAFLDRLRVNLAWRADDSRELQPDEVPRTRGNGLKFFDIGCGSGKHMSQFKAAGYEVVGLEPDARARSIAQSVGDVMDGTAEDIPTKIAATRFDLVLMSHVLDCCADPIKALYNVRDILAPGGMIVIEVPNFNALGFAIFQESWPWTDIPRHINFFTERSLIRILRNTGFDVKCVNYTGYTRQFRPEWIQTHQKIWQQIGAGPRLNFQTAAWKLLYRTAFAPRSVKYDSVRIHAARSNENSCDG